MRTSLNWPRTLLVINYDEWGGFFDHVVPPFMPVSHEERDTVGNDGQLGIRVPCILIGPRARRGHVAHTLFEPNSILKFMEWRWNLRPLGVRAAVTNNLVNALDFSSAPRTDQPEFRIPANEPRSTGCAIEPDNRMTAQHGQARTGGICTAAESARCRIRLVNPGACMPRRSKLDRAFRPTSKAGRSKN